MRSSKKRFARRKNSPLRAGASDGRNFVVQVPMKRGFLFFNYRNGSRRNLVAQCNASEKFKAVDIDDGECNSYCPDKFSDQGTH